MGIKEMIARWKEDKSRLSEFEKEKNVEKKWLNKQKSANERELERYLEEDRQARIKSELEWMRKKRDAEFNSHKILEQKNMFKDDKPVVLTRDHSLLKSHNKLLKGRYLFK